jgi:serine/threonine-protein kinase
MAASASTEPTAVVGRYSIHAEIARGGMATVHLGRLTGPAGFSRTVAIKRLRASFATDPEFVAMLLDEARLASRVRHPNVVSIIDVVAAGGELLLVMDYVQGESLSKLIWAQRERKGRLVPRIASKIMTEVLAGLHAAHEARSDRGEPLGIVHRDVSPQNILVGVDGISQVIDFGVAKAAGRVQSTRHGELKGKLAYMSPEQIRGDSVDQRTDVYAASVVLWEILVGRRLFPGDGVKAMYSALTVPNPPPSSVNPGLCPELDAVVLKGLSKNVIDRYGTALEMADALERVIPPATSREVARWIEELATKTLEERAKLVAEIESVSRPWIPPPSEEASGIRSDFSPSSQIVEMEIVVETASLSGMPSAPGWQSPVQPQESQSLQSESIASVTTSSSMGNVDVSVPKRTGRWRSIAVAAGVVLLVTGTWLVAQSSTEARQVELHGAVGESLRSSPPELGSPDPPEVACALVAASSSESAARSSGTVSPPRVNAPMTTSRPTVRARPHLPKKPPKYTRD